MAESIAAAGRPAGEPPVVAEIFALFERAGANAYIGEAVTQREHALQSALAADRAGAAEPLVAAALLHDIGHLLHDLGDDPAERGIDDRHEQIGADWLAPHFPPEVSEPVRLHVAAKRCLCAAEPGYFAGLSPASVRSLALQGGPMSAVEASAFLEGPYGREAVLLRRCDEAGKVRGLATRPLEDYRALLARLAVG